MTRTDLLGACRDGVPSSERFLQPQLLPLTRVVSHARGLSRTHFVLACLPTSYNCRRQIKQCFES